MSKLLGLLISILVFFAIRPQQPDCITGNASQYGPGIMQKVIKNRQLHLTARHLPKQLPPVDGYIAVSDCSYIGETWQITHNGATEAFLVVDCAGSEKTRQWMAHGVPVEVDYETAARWHTVGRGAPVTVCRKI